MIWPRPFFDRLLWSPRMTTCICPCLWVAPPPLDVRAVAVAERGEAGFLLRQVLDLDAAVRLDVPRREGVEAVHEVVLQCGAHDHERARVEVCVGE